MFREVPTTLDFPSLEQGILAFWNRERIFERLVAKNRGKPRWSFLDGPITANNPMGVHHAWGRTYKDIFQRYRAMLGREMRYQNGFDCQGLWVEVEVEKELRDEAKRKVAAGAPPGSVLTFESKRDIERFGIDRFVELCKERVRKYSKIQTEQSIRLGYWMDWDHSYYTMSDENNYTIWLFLKTCHDRGWIYRGSDVMPWCPRCGTGISEHEMTEGYAEVAHTAVFLRFPLAGRPGESLLVWTTTPWTLTANVAAAVHPDLTYVKVREGGETLYLAKGCLKVLKDKKAEVVEEMPGKALVGWRYEGPFDGLPAAKAGLRPEDHRVVPWIDVTESEGTGIVHIAPGCGREDFALAKEQSPPLSAIAPIDEEGIYLQGYDWLTGKAAASVGEEIIEDLGRRRIRYKKEKYPHRYPHCWRCKTELLFRLVDEWFIAMDPWRQDIMRVSEKIRWIPEYGLERELDWLRNMHDWMISKKRFWGLALPIWTCEACGAFDVIGSRDELKSRAVAGWENFDGHSPHRPWVDEVKVRCLKCGGTASRVKDVGNPWLDAGIVPYSTMGYLSDRANWEKWFPADFITECFPGQFRNWFYSLLSMSTALENRPPFRTLLGHALVRDEKGQEMHKSLGNAIEFNAAAEKMGADVMRWMFAAQNPTINLNFGWGPGKEVQSKLLRLWNTYAFFVTYARVDGFDPRAPRIPLERRSIFDRWILSNLEILVKKANEAYTDFWIMDLVRETERFVDDLSNWYLRRGRERFWREEKDEDKLAAYATLYEVLVKISQTIAPILPFFTEAIYGNLVAGVDPAAPPSIHLTDFPQADEARIDRALSDKMAAVIRIVELGRSIRQERKLKVKQPLAKVSVAAPSPAARAALEELRDQILDELNVKELELVADGASLVRHKVKPNFRLLGPKHGKRMGAIGKALGAANTEEVAAKARAGETVRLALDGGEAIDLLPEEIEVALEAPEGLAIAEGGGFVAALSTEISPALRREGIAREVCRAVNQLRKDAGYNVADRIALEWRAEGDEVRGAMVEFRDFIARETLAVDIRETPSPSGDKATTLELDEGKATLAVRRAG
jgi:isoleucyl-tRNA synthetase